jgi:predicted AAA+ superfamily ATPase
MDVMGKGVYDTEGNKPSLAGRYFHYRMLPLELSENVQMKSPLSPKEIVKKILGYGGFPEPCLEGTKEFFRCGRKLIWISY